MELTRYDGLCVRVTDVDGNVFDGNCRYNSAEYDFHEFGRDEESLQIESFLFYKSDIAVVQVLEDRGGPWGKFRDRWGTLERMTLEEGLDMVEYALDSEDGEHVLRLLNCLEDAQGTGEYDLPRGAVAAALKETARTHGDAAVRARAAALAKRWAESAG